MKRLNTVFFIALVALITVFIGVILVRDAINRHQYERFEQATLQKTEWLEAQNQQLTVHLARMEATMDSLRSRLHGKQTHYLSDSTRWTEQQEELLLRHRRTLEELRQTRKKLNESIRNQRIVVPRLDTGDGSGS